MSVDHVPTRANARFLGVAAAAVVSLAVVDPNTTHVPLCPFHAATGLYCPLCGGLRAVHALTRGDVASALRDNVLMVAALPIVLAAVMLASTAQPRWRTIPRRHAAALLVAAMLAFSIVRNLPFATAIRPG